MTKVLLPIRRRRAEIFRLPRSRRNRPRPGPDHAPELPETLALLPDAPLKIADAADQDARERSLIEMPMEDRRAHFGRALREHVQLPRAGFDFCLKIFEVRFHDRLGLGATRRPAGDVVRTHDPNIREDALRVRLSDAACPCSSVAFGWLGRARSGPS